MAELTLPSWFAAWCGDRLGSRPGTVGFGVHSISTVCGVRLADGRDVVVKLRPDEGRAATCVAAQTLLADRGFPCPHPLTPVDVVDGVAVHAEEYRPGGEIRPGEDPARYAEVFARLMAALTDVSLDPPLPNPRWARWDHPDPGLWPAIAVLDERDQTLVPTSITDTATRARRRLLATDLPCVLGHADYEAQNLRWRGQEIWMVHDWDSLAWQPEAALVGAASGTFTSGGPPTLALVESSATFLAAYQDARGRAFTTDELEIAWAGSLWPAAHNARWEALHGDRPICRDALSAQVAERLRRAKA